MTKKISNHPEHNEIVSMLPWFVNQTLDGPQRGVVQNHIENCDDCQSEIRFLTSLNETVQLDAKNNYQTHVDVDKNLANVMDRIDAKSHPINAVVSAPSLLLAKLGELFKLATAMPTAQWGATALAGLLVAVLGFQLYIGQPNNDYSVLSSSDIADSSMRLSVELSSSMNNVQARSEIEYELEKFGQSVDIEKKTDDVYIIVFRELVGVSELSKIVSELEKGEQFKRVELMP